MLNELVGLLIALVPVILAIIFTKRYNMVHGLITYIVFSYLLVFCLGQFGDKLPAEMLAQALVFSQGTTYLVGYLNGLLLKIPGLNSLLEGENGKWFYLGVYVLLFIIFQIVSSVIRSKRKKALQRLKRASKRY